MCKSIFFREQTLKEMGYSSYAEYLASDLWKSIRKQVLDNAKKCVLCKGKPTEVHHKNYHRPTLEGKTIDSLVPLCRFCHYRIEFTKGKKNSLATANTKLKKGFYDKKEIELLKNSKRCKLCLSKPTEVFYKNKTAICLCSNCYRTVVFNGEKTRSNKFAIKRYDKLYRERKGAKGYEGAGFQSYKEYLESPLWAEIREDKLKKRNYECCCCGGRATQIHHSSYDKKVMAGEDDGRFLYAVCKDCHHKLEFTDGKKNSLEEANKKLRAIIKSKPIICREEKRKREK